MSEEMTRDQMRAAAISLQAELFKGGDPFDGSQWSAMQMTRFVLQLVDESNKLADFKAYVHGRLDATGVSVDPESPHKAEGCRIGGRLDELIGERDRLRECISSIDIGGIIEDLDAIARGVSKHEYGLPMYSEEAFMRMRSAIEQGIRCAFSAPPTGEQAKQAA